MQTISEIRHANLLRVLEREGNSVQAVATKLGKQHAQISQLKNQNVHSNSAKPRVIGDSLARQIEKAYGLERGWMDNVGLPWPGDEATAEGEIPTAVVADIMRKAAAGERAAWISGLREQLKRSSAVFTNEELSDYQVALDRLEGKDKPAH